MCIHVSKIFMFLKVLPRLRLLDTANIVKIVKYYYNLKQLFSMWISVKIKFISVTAQRFQHHYSSLQCHMIFRNHANMLICCSRNISDYYQYWKQLCCTIFLWKPWTILFFRIHRWIERSKEQHLFEIEIFSNIIYFS